MQHFDFKQKQRQKRVTTASNNPLAADANITNALIMNAWQKHIVKNSNVPADIPVSIGFLASGKVRLTYSYSSTINTFDKLDEAYQFVKTFLNLSI